MPSRIEKRFNSSPAESSIPVVGEDAVTVSQHEADGAGATLQNRSLNP